MNAIDLARSAYATSTPIRSAQATEYDTFAKITQRLRTVSTAPTETAALIKALSDNRRLWTLLAMDVADGNNGLPVQLRAQIFFLAEFTEHHSRLVMRGDADIEPLIDINSAVMKGLRAQVGAP